MIHTEDKPPLTRRWTLRLGMRMAVVVQTSAHAEMDPPCESGVPVRMANLRSRGDGPHIFCSLQPPFCKPPLTRRWTLPRFEVQGFFEQTSAHAEMDLPP